jgi:hypothetical protein
VAEAEGLLIVSALTGLLGWRAMRASRGARRERLLLLDAFLPALTRPGVQTNALGYPIVRGALDGHPIRLELIPDTLAFRALPVLWLEARWVRPHSGRLRLVVQPTGAEYFGDDHTLTRRFHVAGWPAPTEVWGGTGGDELLRRLEAVDPAAAPPPKLISIREDHLCVTFRCAKADPSAYRVLRKARFEAPAVDAAFVAGTIRFLRSIEAGLDGEEVRS